MSCALQLQAMEANNTQVADLVRTLTSLKADWDLCNVRRNEPSAGIASFLGNRNNADMDNLLLERTHKEVWSVGLQKALKRNFRENFVKLLNLGIELVMKGQKESFRVALPCLGWTDGFSDDIKKNAQWLLGWFRNVDSADGIDSTGSQGGSSAGSSASQTPPEALKEAVIIKDSDYDYPNEKRNFTKREYDACLNAVRTNDFSFSEWQRRVRGEVEPYNPGIVYQVVRQNDIQKNGNDASHFDPAK